MRTPFSVPTIRRGSFMLILPGVVAGAGGVAELQAARNSSVNAQPIRVIGVMRRNYYRLLAEGGNKGCRVSGVGCRIAKSVLPTPDFRLPTPDSRLPTPDTRHQKLRPPAREARLFFDQRPRF